MKMESDPEIENMLLQINTGHVEIIYPDRDAADEMNSKFAKMQVKLFQS